MYAITMPDTNVAGAVKFVSMKSLLCFSITAILFTTSFLFVLRVALSKGNHHSIDLTLFHNLLPNFNNASSSSASDDSVSETDNPNNNNNQEPAMVALVVKSLGFGSLLLPGLKFESHGWHCWPWAYRAKLWLQLGPPQVPGGIGPPGLVSPMGWITRVIKKKKNNNNNQELFFDDNTLRADSENVEPKQIPETTTTTHDDSDSMKCSMHEKVALLKVFMYDLPSEFHFGLTEWKPEGKSVWPDIKTKKIPYYPGFLFLQHSVEYWLTLDLLASELPEEAAAASNNVKTAIRVRNSSDADIIFVPFFSSLSYNLDAKRVRDNSSRNNVLQDKLVKYLTSQDEWNKSGGRDHLILAHHPNSILNARKKLWHATFILSDFGRYPTNMANVEKDVIAPYKHLIESFVNDSSSFDSRPTLLYFQGGIKRKDGGHVRQELYSLLKDEKGVHFSFGNAKEGGVDTATEGMRSSKFCLNIAGDTPSSNRLFDAIVSHCVPVIISDEIELPYEDVLDYTEFCIFVRTSDALKEKFLINFIKSIGKGEWTRMWNKLKEVKNFFEFRFPSKEGDAVQMIWQAVARKVPFIRLKTNRYRRFSRSDSS